MQILDVYDDYFTVRAITSDAITDAVLTMVEVRDSLYELFVLYFELS